MVLVFTLLISGLFLIMNSRVNSAVLVLARIQEAHLISIAKFSITEEIRANPKEWLAFDDVVYGKPAVLRRQGRDWEIRFSDVEGLVDLYLAPPRVLALLTGDRLEIERRRRLALSSLVPGERYSSEEQTLARFGFNAVERARLLPLATQRARTGEINFELAPNEIRASAGAGIRGDKAGGDVAELTISLLR